MAIGKPASRERWWPQYRNNHQGAQAVLHGFILRVCPISLQSLVHFLGLLPLLLDQLGVFGPWQRRGFALDRRVQFRTPTG